VNGPDLSVAVERAFCDHFGHRRPSRASVSFLGVEPIEVLRFGPRFAEPGLRRAVELSPLSGAASTSGEPSLTQNRAGAA